MGLLSLSKLRDHPRMCGEHTLEPFRVSSDPGSSPHVRGARGSSRLTCQYAGIIPACAGSTCRPAMVDALLGDHPRMCGEHGGDHKTVYPITGSSPHVRGAQRT